MAHNGESFPFEIEEHISTLSEHNGYTFELNRVAFRDYPAKLDLRRWRNGQPLKGVAMTDSEGEALCAALIPLFRKE